MQNQYYTKYDGPSDGTKSHFSHHYEHKNKKDKTVKTDIICFDSRERSTNIYPDPENYEIILPTIYKNVVSVELLDACIPVSQYVIDTHNNKLDICYSGYDSNKEQNIVIPPGNYKYGSDNISGSLANKLKELFEGIFPNTWTLSYNEINNKMTISVNLGEFTLRFNDGKNGDRYNTREDGRNDIIYGTNIRSILGFKLANIGPVSSVTSDYQVDLEGVKYIIFHLNDYYRIVSDNSGVMNGFAKIALNNKPIKYIEAPAMDKKIIKNFEIPIGKLQKLSVKFSTFGNKYYNFNGMEHSLTFRVSYLD
tara:strand:+ start:993 stop:1916 length:924 start_codon:yes stop_codon:yes gene_type:complete